VSQQHGLDHDGTKPTGSSKSDHDDHGMQKKNENVAHAQDGIKLGKLKNSGPLVEFATDMHAGKIVDAAIKARRHGWCEISGGFLVTIKPLVDGWQIIKGN
jgi:hypothetical protein